MTDPRIERLTEMVTALRQEGYNRQESIELLYARIEALEAAQQPQQDQFQDTPKMVDTGWRRLHDLSPIMEPAPPAHAGGLVRRMSHLLAKQFIESRAGDDCTPFARDVLREVAAWLRDLHPSPGMASAANRLDLEAER